MSAKIEVYEYEKDFTAWVSQQIEFLKTGEYEKIDIDNLIEEMETMGKSENRSLESYFEILICHMLKWRYQPEQRSGSWKGSIGNARRHINKILKDSPSLKNYVNTAFEEAWEGARQHALDDTGLSTRDIPNTKIWTADSIMYEKIDESTIVSRKLI